MQGHDVERVREDLGIWIVECVYCGKTFEARRSDASFCSSAHRQAYHHRKVKMLRRLHDLDDLSTWAWEIVKIDTSPETLETLKHVANRCLNAIRASE